MTTSKLCVECKFHRALTFGSAVFRNCKHPDHGGPQDVVTGNIPPADPYEMRALGGACGPDGVLWEKHNLPAGRSMFTTGPRW